jgi:hypothetical protein
VRKTSSRGAALLLALASLSGCAGSRGSSETGPTPEEQQRQQAAILAPMKALPTSPEEFLRRAHGTYVVVDLDVNRLRLMQDTMVLWEAKVGTGTGLLLHGKGDQWHFSTPRGVFQIQYKEELPVWVLPDWYYVEKKLPIPPQDAPERKLKNQLGVAAVYLGQDIAIHGTERPELLGQRVSHGCIRLDNAHAQRLFHNVQIGTPVVIIGGEGLDTLPPPPTTDPGKPRPPAPDPFAGVSTDELLVRLDDALANPDTSASWVSIVSRLITRGVKDDSIALRGVLARSGTAATEKLNREYATVVADAYSRGGLRAVVSLARIDAAARARAARAIVTATMSLYPLDPYGPGAPWPTSRIPPGRLGPDGTKGWKALARAESEYREKLAHGGRAPSTGEER